MFEGRRGILRGSKDVQEEKGVTDGRFLLIEEQEGGMHGRGALD